MARTITKGDESKAWYRKTCGNCNAVFEFKEKDIWVHSWQGDFFAHKTLYVSCPECGEDALANDVPEVMWHRVRECNPVLRHD